MVKRKSAGGCGYNQEGFALKVVDKGSQCNVELEVPIRALGHPYLTQLVSCFETEVYSSYLSVCVFRQLLMLKFTMNINM
jgi:hypothetical protein